MRACSNCGIGSNRNQLAAWQQFSYNNFVKQKNGQYKEVPQYIQRQGILCLICMKKFSAYKLTKESTVERIFKNKRKLTPINPLTLWDTIH